jgi:hypothetical protein
MGHVRRRFFFFEYVIMSNISFDLWLFQNKTKKYRAK